MSLLMSKKIAEATERGPERWESILSTPSGFMTTESIRKSGTTAGGKSWSRFREEYVQFFSLRSGKLRVYSRERVALREPGGRATGRSKMGPIRDNTANAVSRASTPVEYIDERYHIGAKHLGYDSYIEFISKEFPMHDKFNVLSPGAISHMRTETLVDLCRDVMGRNYQRVIPRALGAVGGQYDKALRSSFLQTVKVFQGIVPTDWIVDLFVVPDRGRINLLFQNRDDLRDLRRFLKTANETQLRRLTRNPPNDFQILLRDTFRTRDTLEGVEFRTIQDLHDEPYARDIAARGFTYTPPPAEPIEYSGAALKFVGDAEGFSIVAPKDTKVLQEWSNFMHNCINGYGTYAAKGNTLLYAVMQENKMVANMELDPKTGSIKQLLGKYNQSLDTNLSSAVKSRVLSVWPSADVDNGWE